MSWREALTPPYAFHPGDAIRRDFAIKSGDDVDLIIRFIADESEGRGHGRLRARLCRRLKHVALSDGQRHHLADAIGRRLLSGKFSEHFFDQLRALARIDHAQLVYWCERALAQSTRAHVRRFAARALTLPATPVLSPRWRAVATEVRCASPAPRPPHRRLRWVPDAQREAKAAADRAGLALYAALWSSPEARRKWLRLRRTLRASDTASHETRRSIVHEVLRDTALALAADDLIVARAALVFQKRAATR